MWQALLLGCRGEAPRAGTSLRCFSAILPRWAAGRSPQRTPRRTTTWSPGSA